MGLQLLCALICVSQRYRAIYKRDAYSGARIIIIYTYVENAVNYIEFPFSTAHHRIYMLTFHIYALLLMDDLHVSCTYFFVVFFVWRARSNK